jgi:hypothetical protein
MTINLYDTMHCPRCFRCESCGTADGLLTPWAVRIRQGVLCITLCPTCIGAITREAAPVPIADRTAEKLVDQHCEHLHVSRRNMAEMLRAEDERAREAAVAAVEAGALPTDPDFLRAVTATPVVDPVTKVSVNGHGVRPPGHEHVHCSVCGDEMVHVDIRPRDGARVYAAHPSIVGEPDSVQCSNTDHVVGTHRGGPVPQSRRR